MLGINIHRTLYWLGLTITACALPVSVYFTSVGLIVLISNFVLEWQWRSRWKAFRENRALQIGLLVYVPLLLSLPYTDNFAVALERLRLWLPLLLLPPIIALSSPLSRQEMLPLLGLYVLTVLVASVIAASRLPLFYRGDIESVREVYPYISHIRFALMIVLAIALMFYLYKELKIRWLSVVLAMASLWLVVLLMLMRVGTGLLMMLWLAVVLLYFKNKQLTNGRQRRALYAAVVACIVAFLLCGGLMCYRFFRVEPIDFATLPAFTANGKPYVHDTLSRRHESGHLTDLFVCDEEMRSAWNARSSVDYDGYGDRGQLVEHSLRRYLTSLGLTKDSLGVAQLDSLDQRLIELSYPTALYRHKWNPYLRVYETFCEFEYYAWYGYVRGSLIQRYVYAKAALCAIAANPLFGAGCGDLQATVDAQYEQMPEMPENRKLWLKPHNQFLTVAVCAGLFGLCIFIIGMLVPFVRQQGYRHYVPLFFWGMMLLSMLFEDTLETHIGISLTAFFGALFIYGYGWNSPTESSVTLIQRLFGRR